ncbi:hypothetical protein GIY56_12210 [Paracoccus sp. YIM 132242]|uniref:DUF2946 domain-containing protein n=1 Tax=Paracoccus lichenicola TaxID=2665644 RepID=A0A6L6HRJ6_9RHOB|nr:hypothetical protein [Paracoccus lichenicola]MTE01059.1 hypothetical protein [Paracoccus lichenicola]
MRLCLAILPVLMLLAGGPGFAPRAGAMAVVLCSEGAMKTVLADPGTGPAPQDCRDCPACTPPLPAVLAQADGPARPADWRPAFHLRPITAAVLSRKAPGPLSRGPPPSSPGPTP